MTVTGASADVELVRVGVGHATWWVRDGAGLHPMADGTSLGSLLSLRATARDDLIEDARQAPPMATTGSVVAPVDADTEIWAAGVTYETSREARVKESAEPTIYERVYEATRPELFFKAVGWRTVGPGEPIGVRVDSAWNVPEPELALVVDAHGEIAGFTVCNDVSSRSIEADNPLYLPQAKCYHRSCALGPAIVPASQIVNARALEIAINIERGQRTVWSGSTSTSLMRRTFDDLITHLFAAETFPRGVVLSTGTAAVPPPEFTLTDGDLVTVTIESLGTLRNPVIAGSPQTSPREDHR